MGIMNDFPCSARTFWIEQLKFDEISDFILFDFWLIFFDAAIVPICVHLRKFES